MPLHRHAVLRRRRSLRRRRQVRGGKRRRNGNAGARRSVLVSSDTEGSAAPAIRRRLPPRSVPGKRIGRHRQLHRHRHGDVPVRAARRSRRPGGEEHRERHPGDAAAVDDTTPGHVREEQLHVTRDLLEQGPLRRVLDRRVGGRGHPLHHADGLPPLRPGPPSGPEVRHHRPGGSGQADPGLGHPPVDRRGRPPPEHAPGGSEGPAEPRRGLVAPVGGQWGVARAAAAAADHPASLMNDRSIDDEPPPDGRKTATRFRFSRRVAPKTVRFRTRAVRTSSP
mmetsp:Transcript_27832/g.65424  ORF Transcript_27832/g.65424 Transcript_27832/m.65424 type:complete len:280 (-) Transcript_27832:191-1030(-)